MSPAAPTFDRALLALGANAHHSLASNSEAPDDERHCAVLCEQLGVEMSVERMRRLFEINVLGAYICAREAARRLSRSRGGRGGSIVTVSSVAARLGSPFDYVDYAGSKGAVDSLTIGLSKELAAEGVLLLMSDSTNVDRPATRKVNARWVRASKTCLCVASSGW